MSGRNNKSAKKAEEEVVLTVSDTESENESESEVESAQAQAGAQDAVHIRLCPRCDPEWRRGQ